MEMATDAASTFPPIQQGDEVPSLGERLHLAAMREIADQWGRPLAEVSALYRDVFEALSAHARVANFLPVFVVRQVRDHYRNLVQ